MGVKGRVLTGARARFYLNGKQVGYATNVSLGEGITYEPIKVLGNIEVEEHVPTDYEVQRFTTSMFRIVGETVKSVGWFPKIGGSSDEHLENILTSGDLTATIEDIKNQQNIATVEQVKVASHNYTIDARGVVGEEVEFVAVRVRDESEI